MEAAVEKEQREWHMAGCCVRVVVGWAKERERSSLCCVHRQPPGQGSACSAASHPVFGLCAPPVVQGGSSSSRQRSMRRSGAAAGGWMPTPALLSNKTIAWPSVTPISLCRGTMDAEWLDEMYVAGKVAAGGRQHASALWKTACMSSAIPRQSASFAHSLALRATFVGPQTERNNVAGACRCVSASRALTACSGALVDCNNSAPLAAHSPHAPFGHCCRAPSRRSSSRPLHSAVPRWRK